MIKSMTGFGDIQKDDDKYHISVEIKSLNSKFLDLTVRLPRQFADKELEIRNLISPRLKRGKISFSAEFESKADTLPKIDFNEELFRQYYSKLKKLADDVKSDHSSLFKLAMQQPDVAVIASATSDESHWGEFLNYCLVAIDKCDQFRSDEGRNLEDVLMKGIKQIQSLKKQIEEIDSERLEQIKDRINGNIIEAVGKDKIDENRFEQELIYYIEKLDITEELVRLDSHIHYFMDVVGEEDSNGKKLGFISQELGREINTIGSKSNFAPMQKMVVQMKDELEKIKEQVLNVL